MKEKLFISYSHKDSHMIDTITRRLEVEFGKNNIFYDEWSIQPGDSIIGKMNEGLEAFTTFFFFISPESLTSRMVSLEWQTALHKAVKEDLKFVAVRIAECNFPAILMDKLYIDLIGEGLDSAVEKMKYVVKSESTYRPLDDVQNLTAEISLLEENRYAVTIYAKHFAENLPTFLFACKKNIDDFWLCLTGAFSCGQCNVQLKNGKVLSARTLTPQHSPVKPGFPLKFIVEAKTKLTDCYLFKLMNSTGGIEDIPLDIKYK